MGAPLSFCDICILIIKAQGACTEQLRDGKRHEIKMPIDYSVMIGISLEVAELPGFS